LFTFAAIFYITFYVVGMVYLWTSKKEKAVFEELGAGVA
jgi:hypothetical protein